MSSYLKNDENNTQLMLHIKDMVLRTEKSYRKSFTAFLDIHQRKLAEENLKKIGSNICFKFFGGYADAERTVLCIYDEYDEVSDNDFPFECITIEYDKNKKLSHRDFLGTFMSCMIKRNVIGDIIISDGIAQVFVLDNFVDVIMNDISKIADVGVKFSTDKPVIDFERSFDIIESTVASVRVDAVIHVAASLSREKAAELIRRGLVVINGMTENSASDKMEEGDIFSVRGFGKFRLKEIGGLTKKGRIRICVEKYK